MRFPAFTNMVAIACCGVLASCTTRPEPPAQSGTIPPRPASALSQQVFQEVNSYRRSQGKPALQRHPGLDRIALEHSEFLRKNRGTFGLSGKNVSHFGFENRALNARERYQMGAVAENVAATPSSSGRAAPALLKLWTSSERHKANLCKSWTYTGIGIVVDRDGMIFATEVFGCLSPPNLTRGFRFIGP